MTIHVASNEQQPYTFERVKAVVPFHVKREYLPTADYLVNRLYDALDTPRECCAVVERKSLADLYGTIGTRPRRERFVHELERMTAYGYRAIVIEAEWVGVLNPNAVLEHPTGMRPKSAFAMLLAWSQRYGVHVFACPGREAAELFTFRILERWYRDGQGEAESAIAQ